MSDPYTFDTQTKEVKTKTLNVPLNTLCPTLLGGELNADIEKKGTKLIVARDKDAKAVGLIVFQPNLTFEDLSNDYVTALDKFDTTKTYIKVTGLCAKDPLQPNSQILLRKLLLEIFEGLPAENLNNIVVVAEVFQKSSADGDNAGRFTKAIQIFVDLFEKNPLSVEVTRIKTKHKNRTLYYVGADKLKKQLPNESAGRTIDLDDNDNFQDKTSTINLPPAAPADVPADCSEKVTDALKKLRIEMQDHKDDVKRLEKMSAQATDTIKKLREQIDSLTDAKESAENQLKQARGKDEELAQLNKELQGCTEKTKKLQSTLQEQEKLAQELQKQLQEAKEQTESLQTAADEKQEELEQFKNDLQLLEDKSQDVDDALEQQQDNADDASNNQTLNDLKARLNNRTRDLKEQIEKLEQDLKETKTQLKEKELNVENLQQELDNQKNIVQETQGDLQKESGNLQQLKQRLSDSDANFKQLRANFDSVCDSYKEAIESQTREVEQIRKEVGDIIESMERVLQSSTTGDNAAADLDNDDDLDNNDNL